MKILWEHGEMKPAEIQDLFPRPIKNAATRSFLRVLLKKGHVSRKKVGKAYYYKATTRPDRAFNTMLRQIIDTFCEGSMDVLLIKLIRSKKMTDKDLKNIKRMADEFDRKAAGGKQKRK